MHLDFAAQTLIGRYRLDPKVCELPRRGHGGGGRESVDLTEALIQWLPLNSPVLLQRTSRRHLYAPPLRHQRHAKMFAWRPKTLAITLIEINYNFLTFYCHLAISGQFILKYI
jgi:hypothetical protein